MPLFLFVTFLLSHVTFSQQRAALNWGKIPFELEKQYDINDSIAVRVDQFKFYVQALNEDKQHHIHLIDAAEQESWQWTSPIAPMQIGIQAAIQTAGVFIGELDPINGMYWAWNTGFISVKCVGEVIHTKKETSQKFEYHLGGYQAPFACIKAIPGSGTQLNCDLSLWFKAILHTETQDWLIMQPSEESLVIFELFMASLHYDQ
ncbi:MAG: hypothetical protein RL440_757 [Bacteroidota bacterium]|jgi:hypothetical protein